MKDSENDVSISGNANDLVDRILLRYRKKLIDPLPININSENIKIQDGQISGLSSIRRCGDCTFNADNNGTKIMLQLEASEILSNFKYQIRAGFIWIKGDIGAVAKHTAVKLEVCLAEDKIHLNSFEVMKLDDYKITQLTGASPAFNWLLKILINAILHTLKRQVIQTLEKEGKESIQVIINQLPLSRL